MADKKSNNVSETFGKYTEVSSRNGKKSGEIKNITSDMWTPISTGDGKQSVDKTKNAIKNTSVSSEKNLKNKNTREGFISEGRENKNPPRKKKKSAGRNKKSRIPKGRPVFELDKEYTYTSADRNKARQVRKHQQLSKTERAYDAGIKDGKSPSELSKERVARKKKRRAIRNVISLTVFLFFVICFIGLYVYSKGAPAKVITVEGESIYTYEEILSAAELETGVKMFSLKEADINIAVTQKLPYIGSVEIKRKLPDELVLTVSSTKEKYLIVNSDRYLCLDASGKIVSDKKTALETGFYRIYGIEDQAGSIGNQFVPDEKNAEKYELVKELVSAMETYGVIDKAVISVTDLKNVRVLYENRIMIYLGSCENLQEKINLAGKVILSQQAEGKTGYIDVRNDTAAYFKEGSFERE